MISRYHHLWTIPYVSTHFGLATTREAREVEIGGATRKWRRSNILIIYSNKSTIGGGSYFEKQPLFYAILLLVIIPFC